MREKQVTPTDTQMTPKLSVLIKFERCRRCKYSQINGRYYKMTPIPLEFE